MSERLTADQKAMALRMLCRVGAWPGSWPGTTALVEAGHAEHAAWRNGELAALSKIAARYGDGDVGRGRAKADGWAFFGAIVPTDAGRRALEEDGDG